MQFWLVTLLTRMDLCVPRKQWQMNSNSESQNYGDRCTFLVQSQQVNCEGLVMLLLWGEREEQMGERTESKNRGRRMRLRSPDSTIRNSEPADCSQWPGVSCKINHWFFHCRVTFMTFWLLFWMTAVCNTPTYTVELLKTGSWCIHRFHLIIVYFSNYIDWKP